MALSSVLDGSHGNFLLNDDNFATISSLEQKKVEDLVLNNYQTYKDNAVTSSSNLKLFKSRHISYLKKGLFNLPPKFSCLDASRPWFCFWILHSLELFDEPIPEETCREIAGFLDKCQNPDTGGFAGGPQQLSHLAPTYAAVCALCILGRYWKGAYDVINREKMAEFLHTRRKDDGSFTMHQDGEVDIRGAYLAVICARLTNIYTKDMFAGTSDWLARCQTYEGGFAALPGCEAHGGYTLCGMAAITLLGQEQKINLKKLLKWTSSRQMKFEGGFQGRTNKLVDSCYSYWQGAVFPIIHSVLEMYGDENVSGEEWMFDKRALQEYLLVNCQFPTGGLCDKPGKSRDFYHTCYSLSGLSVAENLPGTHDNDSDEDEEVHNNKSRNNSSNKKKKLLYQIHPIYNLCVTTTDEALGYFERLPVPDTA